MNEINIVLDETAQKSANDLSLSKINEIING